MRMHRVALLLCSPAKRRKRSVLCPWRIWPHKEDFFLEIAAAIMMRGRSRESKGAALDRTFGGTASSASMATSTSARVWHGTASVNCPLHVAEMLHVATNQVKVLVMS